MTPKQTDKLENKVNRLIKMYHIMAGVFIGAFIMTMYFITMMYLTEQI